MAEPRFDRAYLKLVALETREMHSPANQEHGYERCELCHFTRHPCDAFEMADAVLFLLGDPDRE